MNNNRGSNRRRGRGSNRQQGNQQLNRIDSRARGNAPQLLEKFRKLAHDSHLNGDRVQEEYYLQFADHYFRVIADQKQRQDEGRQPRRDEHYSDGGGSDRDGNDARDDHRAKSDDANREQDDSRREMARADDGEKADDQAGNSDEDSSQQSMYEPAENPFTRSARSPKPRKPRNPRKADSSDAEVEAPAADTGESREVTAGLDPSTLPPAISGDRSASDDDSEEKAKPKPRRRTTRRSKPPADDAGEPLQAVN